MLRGWSITAEPILTIGSISMMCGNRSVSRKLLSSLVMAGWLSLMMAPAFVYAADREGESFTVTDLMHTLAQVKSAKGTFVERKYLSMMYAPLEYSGTLAYTAPGHLEKYTLRPKPESMILDQDTLMVQEGTSTKRVLVLQQYPVAWAFVESFRSTLAGDIETLNRFYQVKLQGSLKQWSLVLK